MKPSYSKSLKKKTISIIDFEAPLEDQAIIFPCIKNAQLKDYLIAIKNVVIDAKNIVVASRISQDRVLILKTKELVHSFINQGAQIEINPIALASCIRKLVDSILNKRLIHWLEINNVMPHYFYGFRSGRSTVDAVSQFSNGH